LTMTTSDDNAHAFDRTPRRSHPPHGTARRESTPDYVIPSPFDERVAPAVTAAVAAAARAEGVARR
ncbi:hypothetical protein ABZ590_36215, partial [Streptomyces hirsutus]